MKSSIDKMARRIAEILHTCAPSIYLYGSVTFDDFKLGWSDIDILVLTQEPISEDQANKLVHLRQTMLAEDPDNPYYRSFEGGMLTINAFLSGEPDRVVYWGTSGERLATRYVFDSFSMSELLDSGILLYGEDVRACFTRPTYSNLKEDVRRHYETIRQYAGETSRELYTYGWLLDISRCIYTLRTGKIIAKTAAGEWALREEICPCVDALTKALEVRKEPMKYRNDVQSLDYAETLGASIQRYADVLEYELGGRFPLLNEQIRTAWNLFDNGDAVGAEALYLQCLRDADGSNIENRSSIYMGLIYAECYLGKYHEARYYAALLTQDSKNNEDLHIALHQSGMVERMAGNYREAMSLFQQEFTVIQNAFPEKDMLYAANLYEQGTLRMYLDDFTQALELMNRSLIHALASKDSMCIGCSYRGLGEIYHKFARFMQAKECFLSAIAAFQRAGDLIAVQEVENLLDIINNQ